MNFSRSVYQPLPLPPHYEAKKVGEVWRVPYQQRAGEARRWAKDQGIRPAAEDTYRIALVGIDVQNTFCIPEFELFVGGRSGKGAVEDNQRLCEFIYRNLHAINLIVATMDTHRAYQIFHPVMLVNEQGEHPGAVTLVTLADVEEGKWRFNPAAAHSLGITAEYGQELLLHYVRELAKKKKYDLTIWPYHAMLGGIGHALVAAFEEAVFFHTIARNSQARFEIKGDAPLTENYSVIRPEVLEGVKGERLGGVNPFFLQLVREFDAVLVAGQAKSHCVNWTVGDWLAEIEPVDAGLAKKIYLLEDCMSPVVVPGVVDYTEAADEAFERYAQAGMKRVRSSEPLESWLEVG
ncbi:MAG: isochorismatase [Chloroflexota bacterium]